MILLHKRARTWALLLVCLFFGAPLLAETIRMKDGRIIEGQILAQTRTHVQVRTAATTLLLAKADIASIMYRPGPQESKAQEDRERQEQLKRAEEQARQQAEEERRRSEEARLKQAEEQRRVEEAEAAERQMDLSLRRHELDVTLSLAGGSSRLVSERVYSDIVRQGDKEGWYSLQSPWKTASLGSDLDLAYKFNSWRAGAGFFYRSLNAGGNDPYATANKASLYNQDSPDIPAIGVSNWAGKARVSGFSLSGEREFWRTEKGGIGLRFGISGSREAVTLSGAQFASNSEGLYPANRAIESRMRLGEVSALWHGNHFAGGELTLGAGWQSGKSDTTYQAPLLSNGKRSQNLDLGYATTLSGPCIRVDYAHPWFGEWQYVLGLSGRRLAVTMGTGSGWVTVYGSNTPVIPFAFSSSLSWLTQRRSLVAASGEIVMGLRRRVTFTD